MNEIWFDKKPEGAITFEYFALADASKLETSVYQLEIKEESKGVYKGIPYFQPKRDTVRDCKSKILPKDFVFDIFMRLDAHNIEELLSFQNEYGQIISPIFDTPTGSGDASFMLEPDPSWNVKNNEIGLTKQLNEYLEKNESSKAYIYPAVPTFEVSRTVSIMQDLIESTSRCRNDNFTYIDYINAETFNLLANRIAKGDTPIFGFSKDNPNSKKKTVGLVDNIVFHHMETLSLDSRKIWKCAECGKYFQYSKRETINPEGNHFCKPEHASRFHQRNYDQNKRKKQQSK